MGACDAIQVQLVITDHCSLRKVKTLKNIHSILREAINLVELIIEWFQWDSDSEGGGLIYLPHLERLDICDALLLAIFEAPSLQRLKICFDPRQSIMLAYQ